MRLGLVLALVLWSSAARADNPKLARARSAIAAVQYDAAQKLLVDALDDGGSSPAEVAEIYRLSASTAVVLDRRELAEQYYRRWLAIDPSASLSTELAPKIREPFVQAQAYMNAHGRLIAKLAHTASGVAVVIESDPLNMVVATSLDGGAPVKLDATRRTTHPSGAKVALLDEHGNRLVELDVPAAHAEPPSPPRPIPVEPREPGLLRRGPLWAIAAGVTLGGAVFAGWRARVANDDVTSIAEDSNEHTFTELEDARSRRDRYALTANGLLIVSGAFAVTAAIMFATAPRSTRLAPAASRDAVGLTLTHGF